MLEPMMTANEVAEMLGVSPKTVQRLRSRPGQLPSYKIAGCVRFKRHEVEEYIKQQAVKPTVKAEPFIKGRFNYVPGMKVV